MSTRSNDSGELTFLWTYPSIDGIWGLPEEDGRRCCDDERDILAAH